MPRPLTCALVGACLALVMMGFRLALAQSSYLQPFDGAPATPQPYTAPVPGLAAWDVTVHSRDAGTGNLLAPMDASHGPDCAGPPAVHHTSGAFPEAVFACNNHVMTALNDGGYGVIYLTPPVVADFTEGPVTIQFDMSTARTSSRDWVDLWVTPMGEHLQLPLDDFLPDLVGAPRRGLHARMDNYYGSIFRVFTIADHVQSVVPFTAGDAWQGYEQVLTPSAAVRTTFQLILSRTSVQFGIPALNYWWANTPIPALDWTSGIVQLGHHSYNPTKDCDPPGTCGPNTWHWDNVSVSPSLPFSINKATVPYVSPATSSTVTFPLPAQAGDHLRFVGLGAQYEVSLDGGATWQAVAQPPQQKIEPATTQNYWHPVPAGTQAVDIRAQGGWWGSWIARDFALWGQVQVPPSQRTPTPTAPTRTPTVPPTLTPGPTATTPPSPTTQPSPTATAVTAPTAPPTAGPHCGRVDEINGGLVWTPLPAAQCMQ